MRKFEGQCELPIAIAPFDKDQACEYQRLTAEVLGVPVEDKVDLGECVTLKMKLIPAGEFDMGNKDNGPVHRVHLTRPFYLGIFPVTQTQYQRITGENPSHFKGEDRPVECVSWDDAIKFCKKLSGKLGQEYHLPTEAEWEYTCRAGTTSEYCFGDDEEDFSDYGWYDEDHRLGTHPVGKKLPNSLGLYDMHGNVWEWCHDWYSDYPKGSVTDPFVSHSDDGHIHRGGCWYLNARICGSAERFWDTDDRSVSVSFRLARTIPSFP
jgi:formylglycine-generating enzyme required for sulfatase activity